MRVRIFAWATKRAAVKPPSLTRFREMELERNFCCDLRNSHICCGSGESPVRRRRRSLGKHGLAEERRIRVRIGRAIVRMVEPVVSVQPDLEADALRELKVLPQAHVAAQESR